MDCGTKYFGEIAYTEDSIIRFGQGLPGFENEREFVFIEQAGQRPLMYLQSLATPALCFIVLPVLALAPEYKLHMRPEDLEAIGVNPARQPRIGRDVFCGAILDAHDEEPTANLMAPVVIHLRTRAAVQAIQVNTEYSHCQAVGTREMVVAC